MLQVTSGVVEKFVIEFVGFVEPAEVVLGVVLAAAAAAVVVAGSAKKDELAVLTVLTAVGLEQPVASIVLAALMVVVQSFALLVARSAGFEAAPKRVVERPVVVSAVVYSDLVVDLEAAVVLPENPYSLILLIVS